MEITKIVEMVVFPFLRLVAGNTKLGIYPEANPLKNMVQVYLKDVVELKFNGYVAAENVLKVIIPSFYIPVLYYFLIMKCYFFFFFFL